MVRIYSYNDLRSYKDPNKICKVRSNLCTWYYKDKNRFCGNYVSRKGVHGYIFHRRCWRHKRPKYSATLPPVVLLMISASDRTYNRDLWIEFLIKCEERAVPLEFVIYHQDMLTSTVREPHNLLSRYRPFPDLFTNVIPLKDMHGSVNFTQVYLQMLEYGCKIPHSARCIVLTERSIPIRSPVKLYKKALASKCHIDVSYNVAFSRKKPYGLPNLHRGKPYEAVNNQCQGLFTTEFLKQALPCVPRQCGSFGLKLNNDRSYIVTDLTLYEQWRALTGANPTEFLLLNSFLLENTHIPRPIRLLKSYMEDSPDSDRYTVAFVAEWRDNVKRTYVFHDYNKTYCLPNFDRHEESYYKNLNFREGVSLRDIIRYLRRHKRRALFFRQVELP